jgi:hypothetical protein
MTPYEAWHGRKPTVSHLRVFGCLAFTKELGDIGKLDDRSTTGVFIGYAEGSKAYSILDPGTLCVRTVRDVVFDEGRGWAWDKAVDDGTTPTYDDFTIEYVHFKGAGGVGDPSSSRPTPAPKSVMTTTPRSPAPATTSSSPPRHLATTRAPASSPSPRTPAPTVPSPASRILAGELHLTCDDGEPRSFAEAEKHAAWRAAMQSEMDAVETNRTWELADLPHGHRAITLKWVIKLKRDEAGAIIKHKARLVARCCACARLSMACDRHRGRGKPSWIPRSKEWVSRQARTRRPSISGAM